MRFSRGATWPVAKHFLIHSSFPSNDSQLANAALSDGSHSSPSSSPPLQILSKNRVTEARDREMLSSDNGRAAASPALTTQAPTERTRPLITRDSAELRSRAASPSPSLSRQERPRLLREQEEARRAKLSVRLRGVTSPPRARKWNSKFAASLM